MRRGFVYLALTTGLLTYIFLVIVGVLLGIRWIDDSICIYNRPSTFYAGWYTQKCLDSKFEDVYKDFIK